MKARICHMSTVHRALDVRVFYRECKTVAAHGDDVVLLAQHERDEVVEDVRVRALPRPASRANRMVRLALRTLRLALEEQADVYHFHDPELLPVGLVLRALGKQVIYDIHEDVPRDMLDKEWLPRLIRHGGAGVVEAFENWAARRMSCVVAATPYLRARFAGVGADAVEVCNYPVIAELDCQEVDWRSKERAVCYVGVLAGFRGLFHMIGAIEKTDARLLLAGEFSDAMERERAARLPGWPQVEELGHIDRAGVRKTLARSVAGLAVIHAHANLINGLLLKIFEYMAAGIPVIVSRFPLWREVVEGNNCGLCVDPLRVEEIAEAIRWMLDHPAEAERLGANGRRAAVEKYDWRTEGAKLMATYDRLLGRGGSAARGDGKATR